MISYICFFFTDTAPTEIYTYFHPLSLHDALPIFDVAPDGTAWIIGDTILRARYRDGFDKPVMMAPDKVYTLKPTPIATSITFGVGHRIRVEVTSSNFPKFVRNLNKIGRAHV